MSTDAFLQGYLGILAETFEGAQQEWSWYLDQDRNTGLFATLNGLSAELASHPTPLGSTVAEHAAHTLFYLDAAVAALRGEHQALDWAEQSWRVPEPGADTWRELRASLHDTYEALRSLVEVRDTWTAEEAGMAVAALAHSAYHLGALRQVAKLLPQE